ncbi:MAG: hypothetical protein DSY90_02560 [Deltaproteobacteria bacterium]|nr:MAG: hypothetical protein DSY90_02560 [Deltaproteobacteria bacterium]
MNLSRKTAWVKILISGIMSNKFLDTPPLIVSFDSLFVRLSVMNPGRKKAFYPEPVIPNRIEMAESEFLDS